jgi:hypothetical protein
VVSWNCTTNSLAQHPFPYSLTHEPGNLRQYTPHGTEGKHRVNNLQKYVWRDKTQFGSPEYNRASEVECTQRDATNILEVDCRVALVSRGMEGGAWQDEGATMSRRQRIA